MQISPAALKQIKRNETESKTMAQTREELEQELAELDREISFLKCTRDRVLAQIEEIEPL